MKRRGGYTFDRVHPVKFRAGPKMYNTLKKMSEDSGMAVAWVVRRLVEKGLEKCRARADTAGSELRRRIQELNIRLQQQDEMLRNREDALLHQSEELVLSE